MVNNAICHCCENPVSLTGPLTEVNDKYICRRCERAQRMDIEDAAYKDYRDNADFRREGILRQYDIQRGRE